MKTKTYRFLHILTGNFCDFEYYDFPIEEIRGEFRIMFQSYIATKTDYKHKYIDDNIKREKAVKRIRKKYGAEHSGNWHTEIVDFLIRYMLIGDYSWENLNLIEFDISEVENE